MIVSSPEMLVLKGNIKLYLIKQWQWHLCVYIIAFNTLLHYPQVKDFLSCWLNIRLQIIVLIITTMLRTLLELLFKLFPKITILFELFAMLINLPDCKQSSAPHEILVFLCN